MVEEKNVRRKTHRKLNPSLEKIRTHVYQKQ